jgi:predicted DNA-binding transcriptional regulator YafY
MLTEDSCLTDEMFRRVIAIVNLLMSAPEGLSVADLASAVGAAPSIVRGDLLRLAEYGRAPLAAGCADDEEPDKEYENDELACDPQNEVWSLASRDFAFPVTGLSQLEAQTLLEILSRAQGADHVKQRLQASLASSGVRRRVVKAGRTIYGDGQEESKIDELGAYVAERAPIRLVYIDRHGRPTQRDTCPTALVYDWRTCAWYLYGHNGSSSDGGGFRHFRVSRIQSFGPAMSHVAAPDDSLVEEHVKSCWGVECSSTPVKVVVRFADDFNVLDRLYADTADRPEAQYETEPDGSVIYRDIMPGCNEFRAWVATFGESAEILEPAALRHSMALAVQRVLDRYAELDCMPK